MRNLFSSHKWYCVLLTGVILTGAGASAQSDVPSALPRSIVSNELVLVPAGEFQMGDTFSEGGWWERPVHPVAVGAFWMDKCEVTVAKWNEVYNWAITNGYKFECPRFSWDKTATHPCGGLTWYDCVKWCNARSEKEGLMPCYYTSRAKTTVYRSPIQLANPSASRLPSAGELDVQNDWVRWDANGYRLPTETEWERAARGGVAARRFPWPDADTITHDRANYFSTNLYAYDVSSTRMFHPGWNKNPKPYTSPVGSFAPNGYGLYDMAGNVGEWCWDYSRPYGPAALVDPRGPKAVPDGQNPRQSRVWRGGGWESHAKSLRCAFRLGDLPDMNRQCIGFRCVRKPSQ
jgi:formylglycine-generating enzyme required for sulfatase activity